MRQSGYAGAFGRSIVMLCTGARGGMRAVVEGYRRDGVFSRYPVRLLVTHQEGGLALRLWTAASALLQLLGLLIRGRVAAVHSHMAMRGSFWRKSVFNAVARAFGVPVIAHLHGSEFRQFHASQPRWRQALIRNELQRCACVLVLSKSWSAFVTSVAPAARVVELPNCVNLPSLARHGAAARSAPTVLFLGLIGDRKGVFDLLPAFRHALRVVPGARLVIAGNGDVERARRVSEQLAIGQQVELPGWVEGDAKEALLDAADVYVLPSYNENLPVSMIEAMARGLPVLTTRAGGIPELVRDGIDGILVDAGDVTAIASGLVELLTDDALRSRLGASARARVEACFSADAVLPRLYAIYNAVISGGWVVGANNVTRVE
jgi:glycosyltransferase involved in cell wall biosynthesis